MSADRFHARLRNCSTGAPQTPVSGMEWKGMEVEWMSYSSITAYVPARDSRSSQPALGAATAAMDERQQR